MNYIINVTNTHIKQLSRRCRSRLNFLTVDTLDKEQLPSEIALYSNSKIYKVAYALCLSFSEMSIREVRFLS